MKKMDVAYLRVSTETQTEKYGLDMQRQKIIDYCERNGVTIDKWYVESDIQDLAKIRSKSYINDRRNPNREPNGQGYADHECCYEPV